jgi:hypothetical protein
MATRLTTTRSVAFLCSPATQRRDRSRSLSGHTEGTSARRLYTLPLLSAVIFYVSPDKSHATRLLPRRKASLTTCPARDIRDFVVLSDIFPGLQQLICMCIQRGESSSRYSGGPLTGCVQALRKLPACTRSLHPPDGPLFVHPGVVLVHGPLSSKWFVYVKFQRYRKERFNASEVGITAQ